MACCSSMKESCCNKLLLYLLSRHSCHQHVKAYIRELITDICHVLHPMGELQGETDSENHATHAQQLQVSLGIACQQKHPPTSMASVTNFDTMFKYSIVRHTHAHKVQAT